MWKIPHKNYLSFPVKPLSLYNSSTVAATCLSPQNNSIVSIPQLLHRLKKISLVIHFLHWRTGPRVPKLENRGNIEQVRSPTLSIPQPQVKMNELMRCGAPVKVLSVFK